MNIKILTRKIIALASVLSFAAVPFGSVLADQVTVGIHDSFFSPQTITVPQGSTVTWTNYGNMAHTVKSNTGLFNSGTLNPGNSFGVTFNSPGTFNYFCQLHGGMTGTVIITDAGLGGGTGSISASVVESDGAIVVNSITATKSSAMADGTFQNGWAWTFDVTVPLNEQNLMMKFDNWLRTNGAGTILVANNMRFFSSQSSNAFNENTAVYITAPSTYSGSMFLTGNLGGSQAGTRRVNITVQAKIPPGTPTGSYSTNFGILTQ